MLTFKCETGQFIVKLEQGPVGTSRMLTKAEIEALRETKHTVAGRSLRTFKRS